MINHHIKKSFLLKGLTATMILSVSIALLTTGCTNDTNKGSSHLSIPLDNSEYSTSESASAENDSVNNISSGQFISSVPAVSENVSSVDPSSVSSLLSNVTSSAVSSLAASSSVSSDDQSSGQVNTLKQNRYDKTDIFVVTIDATKPPYNADPSGATDSSAAIQTAVNRCQTTFGGGIVFLPKGTYKVSNTINVKSHVIIKGEFNKDSINTGDHGTIISSDTSKSVFNMNSSSGVSGITVFYTFQDINTPTLTEYTFNASTGNFTLENIILINSFRGIGVCTDGTNSHGLVRLSNVKGTVLNQGINMKFGSEVSFINNVSFSPSYWANSGFRKSPSEQTIRTWMNQNSESGLEIAGLEGPSFSNILIDGFKTGIKSTKSPRSDGAEAYAQFYNVVVDNSEIAADFKYTYIDMGMLFSASMLKGTLFSVRNSSPTVIKLFNTDLKGPTSGKIESTNAEVVVTVPETFSPSANLKLFDAVAKYNADNSGKTDSSLAIQKALDDAKSAGGGYVYLSGGIYRLDNPVTVYANTVLCGSNATVGSDTGADYAGTVIFAYYGKEKSSTDRALITLSGKNAGVKGLRIYYPQNGVTKKNGIVNNDIKPYAYTIRGTSQGVFCENLNFYAAYYGIEMSGSSDYLIKNCIGSFYKNAYSIINSTGGTIDACLSNNGQQGFGTSFSYLPDFADWLTSGGNAAKDDMYTYLIDGIGRKLNNHIRYENSSKQYLYNTFAYIPRKFLIASNSEITAVNVYGSRMGAENSLFDLNGGSLLSVNNYLKLSKVAVFSSQAKARIYNIKCQILPSGVNEDNIVR